MKKSFNLTAPNKKPANQVDSVKHEIKKYIARERKKPLPETIDFWDFDCKIGEDDQKAKKVHITEINTQISDFALKGIESIYLEILVKPGYRAVKPKDQ
jgi:hypothetical protein